MSIKSFFSVMKLVVSVIRRESHVHRRTGEAQEGEGGVEKKSSSVGRPSFSPSGTPADQRSIIRLAATDPHELLLINGLLS